MVEEGVSTSANGEGGGDFESEIEEWNWGVYKGPCHWVIVTVTHWGGV